MPAHRRSSSAEVSAAAYHEAGHAVAITMAFRDAAWLPRPPPPLPVTYVEVTDTPGQTGSCVSLNIYSTRWSIDVISEPYRDLMERQIVIHLAGGIAEAVACGERRAGEVLRFARLHSAIDVDLERARAVLGDLFRLTGHRYDAEHFAGRTLDMLTTHWRAVEALAAALVVHRRIEGAQVKAIIDGTT
jgi:hypothetical protein